jgi:hypothetical protein
MLTYGMAIPLFMFWMLPAREKVSATIPHTSGKMKQESGVGFFRRSG